MIPSLPYTPFTPSARKFSLFAHVVTSVGWLGAVVAFLVLSIIGQRSSDPATVRACYIAMNLFGEAAIVPLSVLALLTGIVQSLGTPWGIVRYYWVLTKLVLTIGATLLLLLHQFTAVAGAAKRALNPIGTAVPDLGKLGSQLVFDAGLAIIVLLITTMLSIYKPWGVTGWTFGRNRAVDGRARRAAARAVPLGVRVLYTLLALFIVTVAVMHILGHGMGHHGM